MRKLLCFASGLLQRSRSWWSESGCWRAKSSPFLVGFNEVAPGGASQAPLARLFRAVLLEASTKSLLVERVRRAGKTTLIEFLWLQRSRSWWSESGVTVAEEFLLIVGASTKSLLVERVRRVDITQLRRSYCRFNEVAPGGASQAIAWRERARQRAASTKSLLVERVRLSRRCWTVGLTVLQRSRSWWSESGVMSQSVASISGLLQRSRSWWSESGVIEALVNSGTEYASTKSLLVERVRRYGHSQCRCYSGCFNEVAPGGASQARIAPDTAMPLVCFNEVAPGGASQALHSDATDPKMKYSASARTCLRRPVPSKTCM